MPIIDIDSLDRETVLEASKGVVEAEKQCRIALATDAPRGIDLEWNPGGRGGRRSVIRLEPGRSVVQPLSKAQAWFGPFAIPYEYVQTSDEKKREILRAFYATEKKRVLDRYDYTRPPSVSKGGMEPIGPHRLPNITTTIIESDGTEHEPVILHELYKVGAWDPLKDTFGNVETVEQVKARYEAELEASTGRFEAQLAALRLDTAQKMAEMVGMVKGMAGVAK